MLSNIGRASIRRVGAGASSTSTNNLLRGIWQLHHVKNTDNNSTSSVRSQFSLPLRRLYATITKTPAVAKPKTKVAAKTTKPKAKKVVPKKAVKKPKKKVVKPKKKVAKKVAKKPKARKVLTDTQKQKIVAKKGRDELQALKQTALLSEAPKGKPSTAWKVLMNDVVAKSSSSGIGGPSKEASVKYKSLTPKELEVCNVNIYRFSTANWTILQDYNHIANQNKLDNAKAFKAWVESHTVDEIRLANNARNKLNRQHGRVKYSILKDDRAPKRPHSSYLMFSTERWASSDLKGIKLTEAQALITKEWKALSDVARKVSFCPPPVYQLT